MKPRRAQAALKLAQDYRDVWETPQGQRVLSDLLIWSGVAAMVPVTSPTELAIQAGERSIGLRIVQHLTLNPGDFVKLARQASDVTYHLQSEDSNGSVN